MGVNLIELIDINKQKLHYLIDSNAPYEKIVHQSQKLDEYIVKFYKLKARVN